jgi:putative acetyltransferase
MAASTTAPHPAPAPAARFSIEEVHGASPPATIGAARELLLEYGRFVQSQPNIATFCFGALEKEVAALPASCSPGPGGAGALLARSLHSPSLSEPWIGFVAWRTLAPPALADAWEIKRLWVRPQGRGTGVGRGLVEAIFQRARAAGKSRLLLDTAPQSMAAAHQLYLDLGFEPCPPYAGLQAPGIEYMHRRL